MDLFGECSEGWIIGECKWQTNPIHSDVLSLLEIRKMLLVGEDKAIYFILSESGFAEDLEAIAKNRDDIHLITGENLFGRK